jgi:predicted nucleic acid-binding protein
MITAIDTNILLDILIPDEAHSLSSKRLLDRCLEKGQLVICEVVHAELSSQFPSDGELRNFLSDTGIRLIHSSREVLYLAGERWRSYTGKRERTIQCPKCGEKVSVTCPKCGQSVVLRDRVLSDFMIGAHALLHAELLLTRDRGFYHTYFKELRIGT